MRTSELKKLILKTFRRTEFYGYEIKKTIDQKEAEIELSRLYRVLNEMEKEGLLTSRWISSSSGPKKKMYQIGENGKKELYAILLNAIDTVHEFYGDYLFSLYPEVRVFDEILDWLTNDIKEKKKVGFLISIYSPINEMTFRNLNNRLPRGEIFVINSKNVKRPIQIESRPKVSGEFNDLPFKDDFFDVIYSIGLPPAPIFEESISELSRVLNENGSARFITPSVLLQELKDPYSIGDFIEKHEHVLIEKGEQINKKNLMNIVKKKFRKIKEKELVHITLLTFYHPLKQTKI